MLNGIFITHYTLISVKRSSEPIRQHWVPKVYLRNFATQSTSSAEDPQAHVYEVNTGREFCTSISKILVKKHLYTIGADEPQPLYVAEETLSKIEGWTAPSLLALALGKTVHCNHNHRQLLAIFFATLLMRNPRMIAVQEHGFKSITEDSSLSPSGSSTSEDYTKGSREVYEWYSSLDKKGKHIVFIRSVLNTATTLAAVLKGKPWYLFRASDGYFLTSDNPVVVFHPTLTLHGIGTPGVHIHVAISPQLLLWIGCEVELDESALHHMPRQLVEHMNYFTSWRAERFVVSSREFGDVRQLIRNARYEI